MNDDLRAYNELIKENDEIYRNLSKLYGMGTCAFWILYLLWENDGMYPQCELCHILSQPKQTINSALKKMENDGLLSLCDGKNHRQKNVVLTKQGVERAKNSVAKVIRCEEQAFHCLTEEERSQFLYLFRLYGSHLKKQMESLSQE